VDKNPRVRQNARHFGQGAQRRSPEGVVSAQGLKSSIPPSPPNNQEPLGFPGGFCVLPAYNPPKIQGLDRLGLLVPILPIQALKDEI